ncbi:hypothetical protein SERLA73DRAFT_155882 [Serpula lacrymans var. lacrymans S7.3]|uniref:Uncharacterized protein n=2 Tax=Serpula lacrymans var. lacrymans TaxID=341189 RepID=F8QC03_SERL3|nr:uncharacterized protein SERLADRAFT_411574 [Serpula lacrymans var. lacrymans S7.9]EGN94122.1 hypothetical protein SERLA73DRAFT_155882 [Serpula lacrymans var. lacrymans S7.3]EGO19534.1 hypothetical protein SERLADRAFT_411574 [Serpula lacrymans var. lacrymans S7.9]
MGLIINGEKYALFHKVAKSLLERNIRLSLLKKRQMVCKVPSAGITRHEVDVATGGKYMGIMVLWLKTWWTNCNPQLICGWYCDTVEALGVVSNAAVDTEQSGYREQQYCKQAYHAMSPTRPQPSKDTTTCVWGSHRNIKPEIFWNQLCQYWSPGFETLLQQGLDNGWYNPDITLHRLVFHYIFIPWLKMELDLFISRFNRTAPWHNPIKILPHGRPINIFTKLDQFKSCDFAIKLHPPYLKEVCLKYAPPDHFVFNLVPPAFATEAHAFLQRSGSPVVNCNNAWVIFHNTLAYFESIVNDDPELQTAIASHPEVLVDGLVGIKYMPVVNMPPYPTQSDSGSEVVYLSDEGGSDFENSWTDDSESPDH